MGGRVRREPSLRLHELPLEARAVSALVLIPGDDDMDQALEEVALAGVR
jgi:hypothetical protein